MRHGVLNLLRLDCLLNGFFKITKRKAYKLRITGPAVWGKSTGEQRIPSQKACNTEIKCENIFVLWVSHALVCGGERVILSRTHSVI